MGEGRPPDLNDPFLVDECLSPQLTALAHARGHHATHVNFRGLSGAQDADLMPLIRQEGFVLVTSNARDFRRLYAAEGVHGGLVIVVPGGLRADEQVRLFGSVLDAVGPLAELTNRLVEVFSDGEVRITDWPA